MRVLGTWDIILLKLLKRNKALNAYLYIQQFKRVHKDKGKKKYIKYDVYLPGISLYIWNKYEAVDSVLESNLNV